MGSTRLIITLPESLRARIRALAEEDGITMAEYTRQALEAKAAGRRPKPRLGIFDSGDTDKSRIPGDGPTPSSRTFEHIMGRD